MRLPNSTSLHDVGSFNVTHQFGVAIYSTVVLSIAVRNVYNKAREL